MLQPAACGRSRRDAEGAQRRDYSSLFGLRHYFVIRHSSFVIFRIMTSAQIRQSFLDFFREKKHTIVPSSSLLPDAPNLLFTNAGMNQFVSIFLGQQKPAWNPPRVADTQKCIRAGGKHNDLEDVGLDTYHHTFFEMLGNWSFGDYFKKEAVEWAWELVVGRWKFPAQRLYATVYKPGPEEPSQFDQEAHDHWAKLFRDADLDPAIHIVNGGKADNFWMMGDTGPCGPCSELHVDLTPDGDTGGALVNKEDPRSIEIWNLVFIEFNASPDGTFTPLPQRHIDTGMGFERVTAIIQGTKNLTDFSGAISNYDTDIFRPIFDELEKLSGKKYASTLPIVGQGPRLPGEEHGSRSGRPTNDSDQEKIDIAFRVIADHIRTLSFAIADGIIPSNEGRGYVLRRILRRAVRYGRAVGFHEPFFFQLVDVVARTMGNVFPEIGAKQKTIKETIRREEEAFNKTLDRGIEMFEDAASFAPQITADQAARVSGSHVFIDERGRQRTIESVYVRKRGDGSVERGISGAFAFKLYDTYGFPLDLTQLMARERGLTVDVAGFEKLMEEQRSRARAAQKKARIEIADAHLEMLGPTEFVGYKELQVCAKVQQLREGQNILVAARTPFYAEMGGQVSDTGTARLIDSENRRTYNDFRIVNVLRSASRVIIHEFAGDPQTDWNIDSDRQEFVELTVDTDRRHAIERHHTVTHILHWALHEIASRDAAQKGSYVGPDKLTFDFSSAALTPQQKRDVEKLVNEKIAENAPVTWTEIPYAEAKKRKDIQQFFGEKYGDQVRVVQIGGEQKELNGYSMELCGGTHVRSTSEIGPFRIVREEAIAAGIRRIEAVAGDAARHWAQQEAAKQQEKFDALARRKSDIAALPAFSNEGETAEMLKQIDARAAHLEKIDADVREWEKKNAKASDAQIRSSAAEIAKELAASCAGKDFCVTEVPNADGKLLGAVADALKTKFKGPIFLAGAIDGRVALVASVPKEMTSKFQANKIIQEIAPIVGGKGGGRPENAQGAGTDTSKINQALDRAKKVFMG
jgi:alanyl-tRNA synthetase